jgi:hypothetical protein
MATSNFFPHDEVSFSRRKNPLQAKVKQYQ